MSYVFYKPLIDPRFVSETLGTNDDKCGVRYRFPQTFELARRYWPGRVTTVLDVGDRTPTASRIVTAFGVDVINTKGDLDIDAEWPKEPVKVVFCMEVLEHVWNPLQLLRNIHGVLSDNGILVLTTPSGFEPDWDCHHIVEYPYDRLAAMITKAGFRVTDSWLIHVPWLWRVSNGYYHIGIRPTIRWLARKLLFGPSHRYGLTMAYILKKA